MTVAFLIVFQHSDVKNFGDRGVVQNISAWSTFYAAKWWTELGHRLFVFQGPHGGLAHAGLLEGGDIRKTPQRPNTPLNSYVVEHVEFLESCRLPEGSLRIVIKRCR